MKNCGPTFDPFADVSPEPHAAKEIRRTKDDKRFPFAVTILANGIPGSQRIEEIRDWYCQNVTSPAPGGV